jgi:hydroxymethylglutaryl-CoA reductase (NADPH)
MAASRQRVEEAIARVLDGTPARDMAQAMSPRSPALDPLPPAVHAPSRQRRGDVVKRIDALARNGISTVELARHNDQIDTGDLRGNIESFVGVARVPVGAVGPLRINGTAAHGDFYVPMATTEGALVASYQRGASLISQAGGATVLCSTEAVHRAPCFIFRNMRQAGLFLTWLTPRFETFCRIVGGVSRHCRLRDVRTSLMGREVYLIFEFTTGDAAGQNMVTIATEAICRRIASDAPIVPERWYVESNLSGDKKATMFAFTYARGKKAVAEVTLPHRMVRRYLHTGPAEMLAYWQTSVIGGVQSGSIGVNGHAANALAAVFTACGQDVACVSEAAVGVTRLDVVGEGDLYASVSLPNLIVGTVGGGTSLSTQRECLEMIGCHGPGKSRRLAEVIAATVLAGELSIMGAMVTGDFARAHARYGRKPERTSTSENGGSRVEIREARTARDGGGIGTVSLGSIAGEGRQ